MAVTILSVVPSFRISGDKGFKYGMTNGLRRQFAREMFYKIEYSGKALFFRN